METQHMAKTKIYDKGSIALVREKSTALHSRCPIPNANQNSVMMLQDQIGNARAQKLLRQEARPSLRRGVANSTSIQRDDIGTAVTHPIEATSNYRNITASFDGREFVVLGDGAELMRVSAQSGRPYSVRPIDAQTCHGSSDESYMNNPRYVGIADNGPIPEGEYQFRAIEMTTFSVAERAKMLLGGNYTDPFGRHLHGGDWGAGRVGLRKIRGLPSRTCGNTNSRSGFYLHGGIMPGSSGCIDIGNSAFSDLVQTLLGFRKNIMVTVRYTNSPPEVGSLDRALGRFTYPEGENPTILDRLRGLFNW